MNLISLFFFSYTINRFVIIKHWVTDGITKNIRLFIFLSLLMLLFYLMLKIEKTVTYCVRDNHNVSVVQSDARAIAI